MNKTRNGFNWSEGDYKLRRLSRSFDTLEDARRFAEGKEDADIYKSKGKYKVEWTKKAVAE